MFDIFKNFFRRKALRKHMSDLKSGFVPLQEIKQTAVILDVEDPAYNECKNAIYSFFKSNGIKVEIYYFDFRKLDKEELLLTSIPNTIIRKDLNWYDMPALEKIESLRQQETGRYDLLISLIPYECFPLEFIMKVTTARFKVGIAQLEGKPYDMVVSSAEQTNCIQMFNEIKNYLYKIG